jgi:hypothetical protein
MRWPNDIANVRDEAALKVQSALLIVERARYTGKMERSDMTEMAYLLADARGHLIFAGARIRIEKAS